MKATRLVIPAVGAALILCALAAIPLLRYRSTVFSVGQLSVLGKRYRQIMARAFTALHAKPRVREESNCDVFLFGLSEDEASMPISAPVQRQLFVEKLAGDCFSDMPPKQYIVIIAGMSSAGATATTSARQIQLIDDDSEGRLSKVSVSNTPPRDNFVDVLYSGPASEARIDAQSAPVGSYIWASIIPQPSYELDVYQDGLWSSTYAFWPRDLGGNRVQLQLWTRDHSHVACPVNGVVVTPKL